MKPKNIKKDSEAVLDFVVNTLKVKGSIGVYGRSLGGIASTHLANHYPEVISALIVDRSFCELDVSSERRFFGSMTKFLYRFVSFNWQAKNDRNYLDAHQSFKILTCDPLDEVVDNYSSLAAGVAAKLASMSYTEQIWKDFYQGLQLVYEIESTFFVKSGGTYGDDEQQSQGNSDRNSK
jgi:pimeloyl-ACP methyl ester carboxylesterase